MGESGDKMPRRAVIPRKSQRPPGKPKLKKRQRPKTKLAAATVLSVLEPAHLVVHGIHRTERTAEKLKRALEKGDRAGTGGAGMLLYSVGQTVELEDLDLPDDAIGELEAEIHGIMEDTGLNIMAEASDIVPVDTGHLRESLWYEVEYPDLALNVGDNADYAMYVEEGTTRMIGRPFLKLAVEGNAAEMEAQIDGAIASMLDEQAQNEDAGILMPGETEAEIEIETVMLAEEP